MTLARQGDGTWRFDPETIARVPEMFDRLPAEEKVAQRSIFAVQLGTADHADLSPGRCPAGDDRLAARGTRPERDSRQGRRPTSGRRWRRSSSS